MSTIEKTITVYCDGCFDLFHKGHINMFKKARQFGSTLIVGVISDKDAMSYKRKPFINENFRAIMIENCSLVDKVIRNSPLIITKDFIIKHKIDVVIHGDDSLQSEFFKVPTQMGIMKYVPYDNEISTTEIVNSIKSRHV